MITQICWNNAKSSLNYYSPHLYSKIYVQPSIWVERNITLRIPEKIVSTMHKIYYVVESIFFQLLTIGAVTLGLKSLKMNLTNEIAPHAGAMLLRDLYNSIVDFQDPNHFVEDLNHAYLRGKFTPVYSDKNIEARIAMLINNKSNVMLVGEPGSGKTTTVLSLVKLLESPECPPSLKGKRIYQINLNTLLEDSSNYLMNLNMFLSIAADPQAIFFIDEAHRLNERIHGHRLSNSLKPFLESQKITFIGATTTKECQEWYKEDSAMARRFFTIEMPANNQGQCLDKLRAKYLTDSGKTLPDNILEKAINLAEKYFPTEALPSSAIKVIQGVESAKKYGNNFETITLADFQFAEKTGIFSSLRY